MNVSVIKSIISNVIDARLSKDVDSGIIIHRHWDAPRLCTVTFWCSDGEGGEVPYDKDRWFTVSARVVQGSLRIRVLDLAAVLAATATK